MGRPGITYMDVANAAQQIAARGSNPTIESIRALLKSGSSGTIAPHLRTWKAQQDSTQQLANKENLPEEMIALMKGLWEKVVNQAETKITAIEQDTQQTMSELKQTLNQLKSESQQWQQQYQVSQQEKVQLLNEKMTVEQALIQAQTQAAALDAKYEGSLQQLEEKQDRIAELNRLNQQHQANLEHYREAAREQRLIEQQRYEHQQQQLEHTIQQLQQQIGLLQHDKAQWQQQAEQRLFQIESLQVEANKMTALHQDTQLHLAKTEKELAQQLPMLQHWQTQYQAEQARLEKQTAEFQVLQKQQASTLQKLTLLEDSLNKITAQNSLLTSEKWELGQEKAQLLGQLKHLQSVL